MVVSEHGIGAPMFHFYPEKALPQAAGGYMHERQNGDSECVLSDSECYNRIAYSLYKMSSIGLRNTCKLRSRESAHVSSEAWLVIEQGSERKWLFDTIRG